MKLNGLDLNKIHVFFSVVKNEGFRGAAEELQLTRSALSQSISALEQSLGVSLFQRVGRRLVPTPAALRFYKHVNEYQGRLQDSLADLIGEKGRAEGNLRVGAYLEFAKIKMMPVLEEFLNHHPRSQIKFVFDAPSRLESLLESHKIDLSISVFPHRGSNPSARQGTRQRVHQGAHRGILSSKLYREELILVGSPNLISERPKPAHFQSVPVIDYFPSHIVFKRWWSLHFRAKVYRGAIRSYAASADMVMEMAKRSLGVGVVPRFVYEGSALTENLQVIQPTQRRLYDYIWLNERAGHRTSVVHQAFRALLLERFAD
jgi:DNA-binding transcriptional LysR family regulator